MLRSLTMSNSNSLTVWKLLHEDMNDLVDHHVGILFELTSVIRQFKPCIN